MFWRFGFHGNGSSIDSLLDKEDVSLEALLDEDDLLQECKVQNTRLIDYFQRADVLQRLMGYVTGQIELEEQGQFKYPHTATEVLCSEIWSIVETCINEQKQLLVPFWESVLDRSPQEMKLQMIMASRFAKVNAVFLSKKPAEMIAFIQAQPALLERMLRHIENPSFMDLLVRLIQMDDVPGGNGVLEWLSSQGLMRRLLDFLSPEFSSDIHQVASEMLKGILALATPSPGDGFQNGPASNRFARELASRESILTLASYMLRDFGPTKNVAEPEEGSPLDSDSRIAPTFESSTSSVMHSTAVVIELIRKNNADYFEPYLFHTLRNRLIQVQQQLPHGDDGREMLESSMREMVERIGVVHLGPVLDIMCQNMETLAGFLKSPRSAEGPVHTTVGFVVPLTFERFRLCELFAELLHCSNMSILNRPAEFDHIYDAQGRLQGGLSALEELAKVIAFNSGGEERDAEVMDDSPHIEPSLELPVTRSLSHDTGSLIDSDEDMSDDDTEPGSSDDEAMEEIAMYDEQPPQPAQEPRLPVPPIMVPSSPNAASLPSPSEIAAQGAALSRATFAGPEVEASAIPRPGSSKRNSRRLSVAPDSPLVPGESMKACLLKVNVLSILMDLFYEYPWNNFLHSAVYDVIHQILTGNVESGYNRELTISLFRDARLMHRIVEMQSHNDVESTKPKGLRLGYMGHLTLISEDVIIAMDRFPPDLQKIISQFAPDPEWKDYVNGRYNETKQRDTSLLGGGKPAVSTRAGMKWKVDEAESGKTPTTPDTPHPENGLVNGGESNGTFTRSNSVRPTRENSADFGAPMDDDDDDDNHDVAPHFSRYLADEMGFGSPGSDDEDEDGGWLSRSTFTLSSPPVTSRHQSLERKPLSASGFDDAFDPSASHGEDPFSSDDDAFGAFSEGSSSGSADPFTFSSSFSDEMEESSFDSFGDFGDFQSAGSPLEDGQLTPTAGSWASLEDVPRSPHSPEEEKRMN
ncbi:SIT4 phosphatase-associated protein-domain-containing protein [Mycena floridula]|nr:SIT4 phosphatase-associated protein-domain-containing protein [Mycena floridula]